MTWRRWGWRACNMPGCLTTQSIDEAMQPPATGAHVCCSQAPKGSRGTTTTSWGNDRTSQERCTPHTHPVSPTPLPAAAQTGAVRTRDSAHKKRDEMAEARHRRRNAHWRYVQRPGPGQQPGAHKPAFHMQGARGWCRGAHTHGAAEGGAADKQHTLRPPVPINSRPRNA